MHLISGNMEIELNLKKTIEENAADYFEKSKLEKRRIEGLKKAILAQKQKNENIKEKKEKVERKKKWFEKYRWFFSSDGFLIVGGKNAHQNEEIVKSQMKKEDIYFHAEVFGAPHCIIKTKDEKTNKVREVPETTMKEAAQFAVTFSKAFESGQASADAYSVKPEQVSKRAPSGQSMGTGAFMIYGERNLFRKTPVSFAIGYYPKEKTVMAGPFSGIKKNCVNVIKLIQGNMEKNQTAKLLVQKFEEKGFDFSIDEILSLLPNGKFDFI